jgi:hypothetical protein
MSKDNSKPESKQKPCQILITFDSPTSIEFKIESNEVLPSQFLIAAKMLELMGEQAVQQAWQRRAVEAAQKQAELIGIQSQINASKN